MTLTIRTGNRGRLVNFTCLCYNIYYYWSRLVRLQQEFDNSGHNHREGIWQTWKGGAGENGEGVISHPNRCTSKRCSWWGNYSLCRTYRISWKRRRPEMESCLTSAAPSISILSNSNSISQPSGTDELKTKFNCAWMASGDSSPVKTRHSWTFRPSWMTSKWNPSIT